MQKIETYNRFTTLIDAVCYWLGYQVKIGREKLIHEASLRYPIADAITSGNVAINQINLEKSHPLFKEKRIDLVVFEKDKVDNLPKEIYEFKIAKYTTKGSVEYQRVFDDIVRLAYYNMVTHNECYFLMCGTYDNFRHHFVGDKITPTNIKGITTIPVKKDQIGGWNSSGIYEEWFAFSTDIESNEKEKTFEIKDKNAEKEWGLKIFKNNYEVRDNYKSHGFYDSDKIKIKTICLAITAFATDKTHAAGLWKIESKP